MSWWIKKFLGVYYKTDNRLKYSVDEVCNQTMIDIVVGELRTAYVNAIRAENETRRSQVSLQTGGADYSWLMDYQSGVKLPEIQRMEVEDLCHQMRTEECNRLLIQFRNRLETSDLSGLDVFDTFKEIAESVMRERPRPLRLNDGITVSSNGTHLAKISTVADEVAAYKFERIHEDFSRPSTGTLHTDTSVSVTDIA